MKINRNNYEIYFLDFHEGNLSEGLTRELFSFLDSNPDLKEEFESFEMISVSPSDKKFFDKDSLKKDAITTSNYKTWFVGYIENDLSSGQKKEVEAFVQKNPSLKTEMEIFKQTKLVPDHRIIFENKKELKRGGKIILFTPQFNRIAVAASVILLLISYFLFRNTKEGTMAHREMPRQDIQQKEASAPKEKSPVDVTNRQEIKKEFAQHNSQQEKKISGKKQDDSVKEKVPVRENKKDEPLRTQQNEPVQTVIEKKDSSEKLFAENKKHEVFKPTSSQLSQVFSDDELKELGMKKDIQQNNKSSLLDLASKGINEIGKVTGTDISLKKNTNEIDDTRTYALALGKFSVSHTSGK